MNNTNPEPKELVDDNDTVIIGLGTRVRIRPTVYLVLEGAPRVTGYDPGVTHVSFGIEKRAGGHNFQLNFSNGFGTTAGRHRTRRPEQRRLVHRVQHLAQVLPVTLAAGEGTKDTKALFSGNRDAASGGFELGGDSGHDGCRLLWRRHDCVHADRANTADRRTSPSPGADASGRAATLRRRSRSRRTTRSIHRGDRGARRARDVRESEQPRLTTSRPIRSICTPTARRLSTSGSSSPGQTKQTGLLSVARTCGYHDHMQETNPDLRGTNYCAGAQRMTSPQYSV